MLAGKLFGFSDACQVECLVGFDQDVLKFQPFFRKSRRIGHTALRRVFFQKFKHIYFSLNTHRRSDG